MTNVRNTDPIGLKKELKSIASIVYIFTALSAIYFVIYRILRLLSINYMDDIAALVLQIYLLASRIVLMAISRKKTLGVVVKFKEVLDAELPSISPTHSKPNSDVHSLEMILKMRDIVHESTLDIIKKASEELQYEVCLNDLYWLTFHVRCELLDN